MIPARAPADRLVLCSLVLFVEEVAAAATAVTIVVTTALLVLWLLALLDASKRGVADPVLIA